MPLQLRDYQRAHYEKLLTILKRHRCALDASDTGTGKTYVALALSKALGVTPLVVGTKSSHGGWLAAADAAEVPVEFINYEKLRGRRTWTLAPCPVHKESRLPFLGPFRRRSAAESEWVLEQKYGKGSALRWKNAYDLIIFDEVHRCSGSTSLNSKLLIAAKRQARVVLALSATAADDPRQMKALGYALDQHSLSKKFLRPGQPPTWLNWLFKHGCTPGTFGGMAYSENAGVQKKVFTKLNEELFSTRAARMRKAEIPGFPETVVDTLLLEPEDSKAAELSEKLHNLSDSPSDLAERMHVRQQLELLKVPYLVDAAEEALATSKVVVFVNFTETIVKLREKFRTRRVGVIWGLQTGEAGAQERAKYLHEFQHNTLDILLCNVQAGGESANMHDPTGQVERTAFISPCDSGRQFKQVLGRVHRDGGAKSYQRIVAFRGTYEEKMTDRLKQKNYNLDLLNDNEIKI